MLKFIFGRKAFAPHSLLFPADSSTITTLVFPFSLPQLVGAAQRRVGGEFKFQLSSAIFVVMQSQHEEVEEEHSLVI